MAPSVNFVALVLVAAIVVATTPAEAFHGRPGSRPRNPIFPRFPGAWPSPPTSGFPGTPGRPPSMPCTCRPGTPVPPFPGVSPVRPEVPPFADVPSLPSSTPSSPTDCVTVLAGLMACGTFLTGSEEPPTPQSECCTRLALFLNSSSAASAAGDGDRTLRCLCPVILGDVNKMLPKPLDPVRMMYLPIACGVVLPPQVLFICFTGQPTPPLVSRIPDAWENPSSAISP